MIGHTYKVTSPSYQGHKRSNHLTRFLPTLFKVELKHLDLSVWNCYVRIQQETPIDIT